MISGSLTPETVSAAAQPRSRLAFGLTRRGLLLFLAGALWLAPAFFFPRMAWGMAVWDFLFVVVVCIDAVCLAAPGPIKWLQFSSRRALLSLLVVALWLAYALFFEHLTWRIAAWNTLLGALTYIIATCLVAPPLQINAERVWRTAPALGNEAVVEIGLTQEGGTQLRCEITDDLSAALVEKAPTVELTVYPLGRSSAGYRFTPRERGDHMTGRLHLRYRSAALGLVQRWAVADLAQRVRVYPSVQAVSEQSLFLTRSRQIELQQRLQRQRGLGRDFESLREYREGDDIRDLCWTATARRGVPITRQYQTEKSQPVWLLMDAGRLLQARVSPAAPNDPADGEEETARYTRLDYATSTALALAQLALAGGDRVGMLAYGQNVQQRVPLGRGAAQLRQLMESLAQVRGESGEADHLNAAVNLNRMQPRRSLVLWITDVAETSMRPEVIDGAAHLMKRHLVLFVAMRQAEMVALAAHSPDSRHEMFAVAAAQELVHRRMVLMAQLREQGALTLETTPQDLTAAVLNCYLDVKERALI
ncbi:MAG TPA: DUF58 domain-containing protein [Acidobacteriaceae bacterium]|nr:DUF58 domain-containing protein [Acidobacteriaceae bacterium]